MERLRGLMDERLRLWHERSIPTADLREDEANVGADAKWRPAIYGGAAVSGVVLGNLILRAIG